MKIVTNYDGASIKIIENDTENNKLYLSLKEENGKYSHYYNFKIDNNEKGRGTIYIKNITNSAYYHKDVQNMTYIKTNEWNKPEIFEINENNELVITVKPNIKQEISLVPRYVQEDLEKFIKKIDNLNMKISYEPIAKIVIGDSKLPSVVFTARQHPGETLSSFFVEGVIQEILNDKNILKEYCFIFYPLVNKKGIKNGNHRYTNGVDYNRSWNSKNPPEEIAYIKENLKELNLKYFIDIHNDEITSKNYIRTQNRNIKKKKIADINVLQTQSKARRFVRALIKQKKIINVFTKTANEYIFKKYHCNTFLIEISMREEYKNINKLGRKFIKELLEK